MRLVLSRKGFDASSGGCASPILRDGSLLSIPIPESGSVPYADIVAPDGRTYAEVMTSLGIKPVGTAHFDPDLEEASRTRLPGWRPMFGQAGAASAHLD